VALHQIQVRANVCVSINANIILPLSIFFKKKILR
jgi:hypothetical protein